MPAQCQIKSCKTSAMLVLIAFWLCLMTTYTLKSQLRLDERGALLYKLHGGFTSARTRSTRNKATASPAKARSGDSIASSKNEVSSNFSRLLYFDDEGGSVSLEDVFLSVKTGSVFHKTRLNLLLRTWWNTAKEQTFIFTDEEDEHLNNITGGHFISTPCGGTHKRRPLSCKIGFEYDYYLSSGKKWWCHFDDDNYVNVKALVSLLQKYTWRDDVYLGKLSTGHVVKTTYNNQDVRFWFATGGAGFCISKALAEKMAPWSRNGKLLTTSEKLKLPDDCTVGFIVNNRLGVDLIRINEFHSHLEQLSAIPTSLLSKQITFSYQVADEHTSNTIRLPRGKAAFSEEEDPTRIFSLHCLLHPKTEWCKTPG